MDNRELYIVSIVNPDGMVYNEQTNPNGGGMWRKNRRYNGGGSYGVDPNRNYPFEWYGGGSSSDPNSETYRGPSPGSEPEVQALMDFINSQRVRHPSVAAHVQQPDPLPLGLHRGEHPRPRPPSCTWPTS